MEEYQTACKGMEQMSAIEWFNTAYPANLIGAFKLWTKLSKDGVCAVCIDLEEQLQGKTLVLQD